MAKPNGNVPGTFVSHKELTELNDLLTTFRDYILSHEARIELIEGWIGEFHAHNSTQADSESPPEADGTEEIEAYEAAEAGKLARELKALIDEPADDSEER